MGSRLTKVSKKVFTRFNDSKQNAVQEREYTSEKPSSNTDESSDFPESEETSEGDSTTASDKSDHPQCRTPSSEENSQVEDNNDTSYSWDELKRHPLVEKTKSFNVTSESYEQIQDDGERHEDSVIKSFEGNPSTTETPLLSMDEEIVEISDSKKNCTEGSQYIEAVVSATVIEQGIDGNHLEQISSKICSTYDEEVQSTNSELQLAPQYPGKPKINDQISTSTHYKDISYKLWAPSPAYTTHIIKDERRQELSDTGKYRFKYHPNTYVKTDNVESKTVSKVYDYSRFGNKTATKSLPGAEETNDSLVKTRTISVLRSPKIKHNKSKDGLKHSKFDLKNENSNGQLLDQSSIKIQNSNNEATVIIEQKNENTTSQKSATNEEYNDSKIEKHQESENNHNNSQSLKQSSVNYTLENNGPYNSMENKCIHENRDSQLPNENKRSENHKNGPKSSFKRKGNKYSAYNSRNIFPKQRPLKDGDGFIMYGKNVPQPYNYPSYNNSGYINSYNNSPHPMYRQDHNYHLPQQPNRGVGNRDYMVYNHQYGQEAWRHHGHRRDDYELYNNQPQHFHGHSVGSKSGNIPHFRYQPIPRHPGYNGPTHPNTGYIDNRRYIPQHPRYQQRQYYNDDDPYYNT